MKLAAPMLLTFVLATSATYAGEGWEGALETLRVAETYDSSSVGFAGIESKTWKAYKVFREGAPKRVVVSLLDEKNSVVSCYAFLALVERHDGVDLLPLLITQADAPREVVTYSGCCQGKELAPDVMFQAARKSLTEEQHDLFIAHLIEGKKKLATRTSELRTRTFGPEWEGKIRKLAKEGDREALIALARYRVPGDLPLLAAALSDSAKEVVRQSPALLAAVEYPSPKLLAKLKALLPEAREVLRTSTAWQLSFYLRALGAQKSKAAATVLADLMETEGMNETRQRVLLEVSLKVLSPYAGEALDPLIEELRAAYGR